MLLGAPRHNDYLLSDPESVHLDTGELQGGLAMGQVPGSHAVREGKYRKG